MNYQGRPNIASRSTWGAQPAKSAGTSRSNTKKIILHHCASSDKTLNDNSEYALMRIHQANHLKRPNYSDIAYHFAIGQEGTIMEGRRELAKSYASHANTNSFDENAIQIVVMGNYDNKTMSPTQKNSLENLIAWLCYKYNVGFTSLCGHRDNPLSSTNACPGQNNYNEIPSIKTALAYRLHGITIN